MNFEEQFPELKKTGIKFKKYVPNNPNNYSGVWGKESDEISSQKEDVTQLIFDTYISEDIEKHCLSKQRVKEIINNIFSCDCNYCDRCRGKLDLLKELGLSD